MFGSPVHGIAWAPKCEAGGELGKIETPFGGGQPARGPSRRIVLARSFAGFSQYPFRSRSAMTVPWWRDLVLYAVYVRGFFDSNGDGIGDLRGLAEKLPYIRDLGVGAMWLLPIFPSPLRDDGYDVADYRNIHPDLGTLD